MTAAPQLRDFDQWYATLQTRLRRFDDMLDSHQPRPTVVEFGRVMKVDGGVIEVSGLPGVRSEELIELPGGRLGMAYDLGPSTLGVVLLDEMVGIGAGDLATRTGRVMSAPVGEAVLGRVIDPTGRPLDGQGPVATSEEWPIERPAPDIMSRAPVDTPLQTGV